MVVKYDKNNDVIYIRLTDSKVAESNENSPGVILDYDIAGNLAGIEVLNASKKINQPDGVVYEIV